MLSQNARRGADPKGKSDTFAAVAGTGGVVGWWHRRHGARVRRCTQCGYEWPLPRKEPRSGHLPEGIPLGPESQSAARMIGQQVVSGSVEGGEVREALSHCPQCGSGEFTEHRVGRPAGA